MAQDEKSGNHQSHWDWSSWEHEYLCQISSHSTQSISLWTKNVNLLVVLKKRSEVHHSHDGASSGDHEFLHNILCQSIYFTSLNQWKLWSAGPARGKSQRITKVIRILKGIWIPEATFIHPVAVQILQSGPKWQTNWKTNRLTLPSLEPR